ncbi:hypothetical protein [Curtobacterium sp. ER1/6]|uniref:hypothetical protein n=1 Tax=Curtobacterium sp. ER1/6 TaxID=1891920 RepID=UPI00114D24FC|nr:hypothetical protein [Curtobacterium sp. ER1/6]
MLPRSEFRIFLPREVPDAPLTLVEDEYLVEWRSDRIGHPGSYGCLGGRLATGSPAPVHAARDGSPFLTSLAGSADTVLWGLPDEYRAAVDGVPLRLTITRAAHGEASSSLGVFRDLAHVLWLVCSTQNTVTDGQIEAAREGIPFR